MDEIIESIKNSKNKLYLTITGGGTLSIGRLLREGGASGVFLGANVPYSEEELRFLIGSFSKACSKETAMKMAKQSISYNTVETLDSGYALSVSCTSSLSKGVGERVGREHEAYIAAHAFYSSKTKPTVPSEHLHWCKITLNNKSARTRIQEEDIIANCILIVSNHFLYTKNVESLEKKLQTVLSRDDVIEC